MDFQHREGARTGTGAPLSAAETNAARRERLRRLALENIDLARDPYFMKNHLGQYECRLCLTLHTNEGSYLVHTQGKKHQANLGRRAAREAKQAARAFGGLMAPNPLIPASVAPPTGGLKPPTLKIGRPAYRINKIKCAQTGHLGLLFHLHYPLLPPLPDGRPPAAPLHRLMSAFEQKRETAQKGTQYLIFACSPYESVAFRIPARPMDSLEQGDGRSFIHWDPDLRLLTAQVMYQEDFCI